MDYDGAGQFTLTLFHKIFDGLSLVSTADRGALSDYYSLAFSIVGLEKIVQKGKLTKQDINILTNNLRSAPRPQKTKEILDLLD